ncbi:hypothetical protein Tco_1375070 [Tanacetum coccineum]
MHVAGPVFEPRLGHGCDIIITCHMAHSGGATWRPDPIQTRPDSDSINVDPLTFHVSCHISKWVPLADVADDVAATSAMTRQVGPTSTNWPRLSNNSLPRGNTDMSDYAQVQDCQYEVKSQPDDDTCLKRVRAND